MRTTLLLGCVGSLMAQATTDEYGGPAILSRGEMPNAATPAPVTFRPFIGLNGVYDNGLIPVSVTPQGQIPNDNLFGAELNLGLYGYHNWKRTTVALDYKGDFRHYSQKSYYDGTDDILSLIVTHQPSKHIKFTLRNAVGTYSRNYFLSGDLGLIDPNYLQLPQNDIYDNRVIFLSTAADVTYRRSSRLSFNFGAEGDLIRRRSSALYGVSTGTARADTEYRVTRHSTIGADYRFTHFQYTKGFGSTDIHSVGINYSAMLSRHTQFSTRIGAARVESLSLEQVQLDPVIAVLLGQSYGIQAAYRVNYGPDMMARLTYTLKRSTLDLSYTNGISPGNGVYLTSRMQNGRVAYSYTGIRYWNFGVDASYGRLSALVQNLGAYDSYGGGAGVTRELGKGLHAVARMDARHYNISGPQFRHNEYRATVGLTYSPGDVPLALW